MRILAVILAVFSLTLPTAAGAQISLPSIKHGLIELALSQVSSPGSFEITAGAIEEPESGVTSLVDVKVSDNVGVWMTLERVSFSWEPSAILSGELKITRLELVGLTVDRPPSASAEPPELKPVEPSGRGIFDWPRSPIDLSVEGVRLERVRIAEGVLAQPIAFDAEARAFDKGDLQELMLSLKRTDAVAGSIRLAMRRDFAANTVKLELVAEEAAGGIVAASAGFPDDAPARLKLTADGPPEDWRLLFDAGVERVFEAGGRATLAYADRLSVDADFSVTPGPQLDQTARTVLGERASLRAQIVEREDGMIEVVSGTLISPALQLNASGAFATGAGESDLAVSLVALPPLAALAEGVEFTRFSFDGQVTGPQGGLAAEGALGLKGLRTAAADAAEVVLDGRVVQTPGGLTFALDGQGSGLRIDQLGPEVIGTARIGAAGGLEGDLLTLERAEIAAAGLTVGASGSHDLAAETGQFSVRFALPEVGPVAAAYGVEASGAVEGGSEVTLQGAVIETANTLELSGFAMEPVAAERMTLGGPVRVGPDGIRFDLAGDGRGLVLDQVPPDLTRPPMTYGLKGSLREGRLALEGLRLDSQLLQLAVAGSVNLEESALALDYEVTTANLGPVARAYGAELDGALAAEGRAEGPFVALRIAGSAGIGAMRFQQRGYGDVDLAHDVTLGEVMEGNLTLAKRGGEFGDGEAATRFRLDGAALSLRDLKAQMLGLAVAGQADVDLDTTLADGALTLAKSELRSLGRFTGNDLAGTAAGKVSFAARAGKQDLTADLALSQVRSAGVTLDEAKLTAAVADLAGALRLDARLQAAGLLADRLRLGTLQAEVQGPLGALDFSAEGAGELGSDPLSLALSGRADAAAAVTRVTLAEAEVTVGPDRVALRRPLDLRIGGGTVAARGLDLALPGDGTLTGDAAAHPNGFAGDLTLSRLPLDVLERWAALPVTAGLLDARAAFDTRRGRAGADLTARARGVGFARTRAEGELDLDLDADWDGARLDAKAELSGDFGDPLRASATLPLRPGPGGVPEVPKRGALDGSVAWAGDIGDLWALVPAAGHILDGRADIDLKVSGTLEAPTVSGKATLRDGEYQNYDLGTILTGLTLDTDIVADGTVNVTLDATDGAKGTVAARMALATGGPPAIDLGVKIDRAVLVRRDDVTAKISGDVALTGPFSDMDLKGALTVNKAEVRLVSGAPPEVVELDGIRIKGAPEEDGNGDGESRVTLDLTIQAPNDIFVRGRGLDSEWRMDLAVSGDAAAPVVTGEIAKVRGVLDLLGRPFELARGQVTFDGGKSIDPLIDVSLEREAHGIRGGIVVEGRASAPELRFAAIPELPEDEVLPRLLFGQSRQSLSGADAVQLAAGVATLMSGKAGPLDFAREAVGIDVLRVEGESAEDTSVTVGRNLGDGIFVGARQGLQGQGTTVTVEVDVFDGVKVDSELKQEGGSNVGISWRKDF